MLLSHLKETTLHGPRWNNSPTDSINTICVHKPSFQLSSVIVSLRPSVVFGYRGILLIFLAYETQGVLYVISAPIWPIFSNQENTTFDLVSLVIVLCSFLSMGLIIIPEQHPKRDGQMVKSLTASLVRQEEEERHQRNPNENEQLKKQIAETAQQFTEHLDRMLHTPVTSLITSQATARPLWSIILFGLWPLLSPLQVSSNMTEVGTVCRVEKTAQLFTERLDRMVSTPDTSLITSQGTPRPRWLKMLSGLWPLPSTVYLPN
ncbi:hypothetical protein RRG08_027925 [Elysia crispata]|uniref:Uncharacterized protein n=1 Tax=Elysia crispata TaxID=231223 RepID=A0AAE0Y7D9_9GAST|nr:hypothetical protein RRG08_027925 [Elysia crispata]